MSTTCARTHQCPSHCALGTPRHATDRDKVRARRHADIPISRLAQTLTLLKLNTCTMCGPLTQWCVRPSDVKSSYVSSTTSQLPAAAHMSLMVSSSPRLRRTPGGTRGHTHAHTHTRAYMVPPTLGKPPPSTLGSSKTHRHTYTRARHTMLGEPRPSIAALRSWNKDNGHVYICRGAGIQGGRANRQLKRQERAVPAIAGMRGR